MKKCLVLNDFVDKNTNEYHRKESFYYSKDSKRIIALEKGGFIKYEIEEEKDGE
ncbi:hypothetical protein [Bacillus sp. Hm123]|uniref:hypothetical protein n=1 Tax=Bacillus sp. Hm123 TaxID=3450745 RepID=UPI003F41E3A7